MPKSKIRILLVDDHLVVRVGLRSLLETQSDIAVVAEAASGTTAIEAFTQHQPHVTLMDLRMPGLSGAETTARIRQQFPDARVLVLTTYDNDEDIYRALEAGAAGYLLKNTDSASLLSAIRAVHSGSYRLPDDLAARLAQRQAAPELTPREFEVLQHIVRGQSNKEIGAALGLTENTVKNHVKMILEKLDVADRTQAATTALQRGLARLN
ncbi:MAG: response regulator transcription factor [Verrucomicrobiota bacterium]